MFFTSVNRGHTATFNTKTQHNLLISSIESITKNISISYIISQSCPPAQIIYLNQLNPMSAVEIAPEILLLLMKNMLKHGREKK